MLIGHKSHADCGKVFLLVEITICLVHGFLSIGYLTKKCSPRKNMFGAKFNLIACIAYSVYSAYCLYSALGSDFEAATIHNKSNFNGSPMQPKTVLGP